MRHISTIKKCLRQSGFRLPGFTQWRMLVFWPVFSLLFAWLERGQTGVRYVSIHCALDHYIPFNELFLIPYLFWFVFLAGMSAYTLFWESESFRKMMRFVALTYGITLLIYAVYPNCQNLRPVVMPRQNFLTAVIQWYYQFDTNTNVCPSLHVIGSVAAMLAAWDTRRFGTPGWRFATAVIALLISASTVFLKQHSILDVFAALPVCALGYFASFWPEWRRLPVKRKRI